MPSNIVKSKADEKKWDRAKSIVEKEYPEKGEKSDSKWKLVTHIFENMKQGAAMNLIQDIENRVNEKLAAGGVQRDMWQTDSSGNRYHVINDKVFGADGTLMGRMSQGFTPWEQQGQAQAPAPAPSQSGARMIPGNSGSGARMIYTAPDSGARMIRTQQQAPQPVRPTSFTPGASPGMTMGGAALYEGGQIARGQHAQLYPRPDGQQPGGAHVLVDNGQAVPSQNRTLVDNGQIAAGNPGRSKVLYEAPPQVPNPNTIAGNMPKSGSAFLSDVEDKVKEKLASNLRSIMQREMAAEAGRTPGMIEKGLGSTRKALKGLTPKAPSSEFAQFQAEQAAKAADEESKRGIFEKILRGMGFGQR